MTPDPMGAAAARFMEMADPADFPFRYFIVPEHPAPDADVGIIWQSTPWPAETLRALADTLEAGGGLFLMAKNRGELIRQREAVELLIAAQAGEVL